VTKKNHSYNPEKFVAKTMQST